MKIEAYLTFGGNCEEALAFYERALGGKVGPLMRFEGSPMDNAQLPGNWKNKVMHALFECDGARFMASDAMPGQPAPAYSGFTMSIYLADIGKARQAFEALAQGGQVTMPFAPPFWGGHFGMLKDRFGVPWMVVTDH
jgi:PhnB protein